MGEGGHRLGGGVVEGGIWLCGGASAWPVCLRPEPPSSSPGSTKSKIQIFFHDDDNVGLLPPELSIKHEDMQLPQGVPGPWSPSPKHSASQAGSPF